MQRPECLEEVQILERFNLNPEKLFDELQEIDVD